MLNLFDSNQPKHKPPKWLHWGILLFALAAGFNAYHAQISPDRTNLKLENYPEVRYFVSAEHWQRIMNPHYDRPTCDLLQAELTQDSGFALETTHIGDEESSQASCAETIALEITPLNAENTPAPTAITLPLTLGLQQFGYGLDRAAYQMRMGEVRRVQIPIAMQAYEKTPLHRENAQKMIAQITRVAYTETQTTPYPKEPAYEPDRQTPASH